MGLKSPDISMVERRFHVPARLQRPVLADPLDGGGVDRPSHINVFGMSGEAPRCASCPSLPSERRVCCCLFGTAAR